MKELTEGDLRKGRKMALQNGSDVLHALGCLECQLRDEFLFVLSILGWDEESFMREYFTWLMGGRRG